MILKDKVAIVTGAGSGIGRSSAEILARQGASVVVADRNEVTGTETISLIRGNGGTAEFIKTDVSVDADIEAMIDFTVKQFGQIDILHNHAGVQVAGGLETVELKGMDDSYFINTRAQFYAARLAVPYMKKIGKGSIVNTSSNSGCFYDNDMIAYTTSEAATIAMTKQMAVDYAKFNIRVNALCPGWVDTPFNDPYIEQMGGRDAIEKHVAGTIPLGRWATSEEMAESVLYLASDLSSIMTGHALVIDGGESIA